MLKIKVFADCKISGKKTLFVNYGWKKSPENPGQFKVAHSVVDTCIVTNDKRGSDAFVIPCRDKKQAEELF